MEDECLSSPVRPHVYGKLFPRGVTPVLLGPRLRQYSIMPSAASKTNTCFQLRQYPIHAAFARQITAKRVKIGLLWLAECLWEELITSIPGRLSLSKTNPTCRCFEDHLPKYHISASEFHNGISRLPTSYAQSASHRQSGRLDSRSILDGHV